MAYKSHAFWQCLAYLFVYSSCNLDTGKGTVDSDNAIERAAFTFLDEVGAVGRLGGDLFENGGEGVPVFPCIGTGGYVSR